jgi:hypothetical protein
VAKIAIRNRDFAILKRCAAEWPSEDIYRLVLDSLGPTHFAEIVSAIDHGMAVTCEFLKAVTAETSADDIRAVLRNEMKDRSDEMEKLLCGLISRIRPDRAYLETLFDEPFVFSGDQLIQYVVAASIKAGVTFERIVSFLNRTSNFSMLPIVLISIYDRQRGDELVDRLIENRSPLVRRLLISRLCEFEVSETKLQALFATCRIPSEIYDFCLLAATKRLRNLLQVALHAYLKFDARPGIKDQWEFYLTVMNLLAAVCHSEDLFEDGFVTNFLAHAKSVLTVVNGLPFPAWTSADAKHYRAIVVAMEKAGGLAFASEQSHEILTLLQ